MTREKFIMVPRSVATRTDLTATAKLVYAAISDHIGHNEQGWPGYRLLAQELGVNVKAAQRGVEALVEAGLMTVTPGGFGRSNRYSIPDPRTVPETGTLFVPLPNIQSAPETGTVDDNANRTRNGSAPETGAPPKRVQGVPEMGTVAPPKRVQNQTDPLTRPIKSRRAQEIPDPKTALLPTPLDTPECRSALSDWLAYKTESRKPYKTERGWQAQLTRLSAWGSARVVAAVAWSMSQNYQGLFEEGNSSGARPASAGYRPGAMLPIVSAPDKVFKSVSVSVKEQP